MYISYIYIYIYIIYISYIYVISICIYHIYIYIIYICHIYIYMCVYVYISLYIWGRWHATYICSGITKTLVSLTKKAEKMLGDDVMPSTWWFNHLTCHYNETTWWDWKVNMVVLYMCFIGFDFDRDHSGIMMEYIIIIIMIIIIVIIIVITII